MNIKLLRLERNLRELDLECWDLRPRNLHLKDHELALEENFEADKWADKRYL